MKADEKSKKIAVLEVIGMMFIDGMYDEKEIAFVDDFAKRIGFSDQDIQEQVNILNKYMDVVKEMNNYVSL